MLADAKEKLAQARGLVDSDEYATADDRRILTLLEGETETAIAQAAPDLLRRRVESLSDLIGNIFRRDPGVWVSWFKEAKQDTAQMRDAAQAERLIAKGERSIATGDVPGLKDAVRGLWKLLPDEARPSSISDVTNAVF